MHKLVLSSRLLAISMSVLAICSLGVLQAQAQSSNSGGAAGGAAYTAPGQPPIIYHPTVEASDAAQVEAVNPGAGTGTTNLNLYYHGGVSATGIGVETSPVVYLVLWGSQWNNNDPSGEEALLVDFYKSVGGSFWSNVDTQYCQGMPKGSYFCKGNVTYAGNHIVFGGAWYDNSHAAPINPSASQVAGEAIRAAKFFGNDTAASNASVQYVIALAHGTVSKTTGFGVKYCAFHTYTNNVITGRTSFTDLPYITDGGSACGVNFNGLGPDAGITIVAGHEMSETITDPFPALGWLDRNNHETGDKCSWIRSGQQGAAADVTFLNGKTFPVQSLWSNYYNKDSGGCVMRWVRRFGLGLGMGTESR